MLERFVFKWKRKTARNTVSVSLSCGRGTGSRLAVILHPQTLKKGGERRSHTHTHTKGPPLLPASPRPSRSLCNDLCVSGQARFHSSPAQYFISVQTKKKKEKKRKEKKCLRAEERDGPISLKDLTNAISPRFTSALPPKWVLGDCITLFI